MRLGLIFAGVLALLTALAGCGQTALEMEARDIKDKAIDLVGQGFSQGSKTTQFQAGLQGINPGYRFRGSVIVGTVVQVDGTVTLDGVSGQIQAASQAGATHFPATAPANP